MGQIVEEETPVRLDSEQDQWVQTNTTPSSLWLSHGLSIITMGVRKTKQWSFSTTALNTTVTIGAAEVELTY